MAMDIRVNGETHSVDVEPQTPLLWVLRERLHLRGTKFGCGVGVCGICVVHLDGTPARACVTPTGEIGARAVTTIEGLSPDHPVIAAWLAEQVPQCGYCQPGQIMRAAALATPDGPPPPAGESEAALDDVLCRCGTYPRIRRALARLAAGDTPPAPGASRPEAAPEGPPVLAPNPWVRVHRDGTATVMIDRSEMGQGVVTALATLVAEELELDLEHIRTAFAPAEPAYANPLIGEQLTGGSTSVRGAWQPLRQAGAQARALLIRAAAEHWGVPADQCVAANGRVTHSPSGRELGYGGLVERAAQLPVPEAVALKDPAHYRLIGHPLPRLELPAMVRGHTTYGFDVTLAGMRMAVVARPPVAGARPARIDATETRGVPGVIDVLESVHGVAVVAEDTWAALRGRRLLAIDWQPERNEDLSDAAIESMLAQADENDDGERVTVRGRPQRALARAERVVESVYHTPYLAHGCMEPMNAAVRVGAERCEVWVGTQAQEGARQTAAELTGLPPEAVAVHSLHLGGGFGRRAEQDFVAEAVTLAQRAGEPVHVVWSRDDDIQHDYLRPADRNRIRVAVDDDGWPQAWHQRVVGPDLALDGVNVAYDIPHLLEEHVLCDPGLRTGAWRSVGASQNAFAVETMVDELAQRIDADAVAYRDALLSGAPRLQRVLDAATTQAGWRAPPDGRHQGVACYASFGSFVAQVAEVSVTAGAITVHRVVCAIDCGQVINPDTVRAQVEGGIVLGLSAALAEAIHIDGGRVRESSFEDYPILRLSQTPAIEVQLVDSSDAPGGVGEPGVPPVAPAVANAVSAATGQRIRRLPLTTAGLTVA